MNQKEVLDFVLDMDKRADRRVAELFVRIVRDLLDNYTVQLMKNFIQHGETSTFKHCVAVSYKSFKTALRLGLDYRACARGGLLHDLFLYDWHDKSVRGNLHGFYHPGKALENAEKQFELSCKEREIIKKHMWPLTIIPPKCREAYVICYFDKVCTSVEVMREWGNLVKKLMKRKLYSKKG